jgi:hypothetical protein
MTHGIYLSKNKHLLQLLIIKNHKNMDQNIYIEGDDAIRPKNQHINSFLH